jgi:hypothetical protein
MTAAVVPLRPKPTPRQSPQAAKIIEAVEALRTLVPRRGT